MTISAAVFGLLFALIAKGKKSALKYLSLFSWPLLILSAYLFINRFNDYDAQQLGITILQGFLLLFSLILGGYNRIKYKTTGHYAKSYAILLLVELATNINNILISLLLSVK